MSGWVNAGDEQDSPCLSGRKDKLSSIYGDSKEP